MALNGRYAWPLSHCLFLSLWPETSSRVAALTGHEPGNVEPSSQEGAGPGDSGRTKDNVLVGKRPSRRTNRQPNQPLGN